MAKGTTIGFLNFGIDGDNKELMKKLEQAKKEAVSIEQIFKNIKLNVGGSPLSTDIQKAQIAADKLAVSQNKVTQSVHSTVAAENKATEAIEKATNAKKSGLLIDQKRNTELANTAIAVAKSENIKANTLVRQEEARRKAIYDGGRLAGLQKKNALIGVQGQKDLAAAYGLTNKTMFSQKNILQQLSSAMGIYFSIYQAGAFVKELAMVSGEFEKQRLSLRAIIQDSASADKIFNQIKDLAVYSPFNFKELTDYAKQLSAFSIPTNEIFDTMTRLADISAGLGVDMNRIILAYGQVRSASVLRGQELRQFTEAGIPLVDELAKKFGELEGRVVSAGDVFDKISNREVPFAMIKDIFTDLTSEGGKFYQMQEIQATSLAGKISNLRDAYDIMLDSIGKANSGLLKGAVGGLVGVMDNWEKYWNILKGIILTYGAYKAVIIAAAVAQKGLLLFDQITFFINLSRAMTGATTATTIFTGATNAMKGALSTNPITLFAVVIATLVGALTLLSKEAKSTEDILADLDKASDSYSKTVVDNKGRLDGLINSYSELNSKTSLNESEQKKLDGTIKELAKTVPNAANEFDKYGNVLGVNLEIVRQYNEQQKIYAKERLKNQIDATNEEIKQLQKLVEGYTYTLENGKAALSGYSQYGTTLTTRTALNEQEIIDLQNKRADTSDKLTIAQSKLANAEKLYNNQLLNTSNLITDSKTWQSVLKEALGTTITIQTDSNLNDIIDEMEKKYKELKTRMDDRKPILVKFGFDFEKNVFPSPAEINPAIKQLAESYIADQKDVTNLDAAAKSLGKTLKDLYEPKDKGEKKDKFTDDLKRQVEIVKAAKSEYEKLIKVMSREEAMNKIRSISEYSSIGNIDLSDQGYIDYLSEQFKKVENRNTTAAKNVRVTWNKELGQIQIEQITEKAQYEIDRIEKYLSNYKTDFDFYKRILGITGDKGQAAKLAFGANNPVKEYIDVLKEAFKKSSGVSFSDFIKLDDNNKLKLLVNKQTSSIFNQIEAAEKDEVSRRQGIYAESLKEFASYQDKRLALQYEYDEKIKIAEDTLLHISI